MSKIFIEHLKNKHPNLDVDLAVKIFDEEITVAKRGSPGADKELPLECDLNKNIVICI